MAALSYAQRSGVGQHVDLAMINAMFFTDDYAHLELEKGKVLAGGGQVFEATGGPIMLAGDEKWYWRVLNTKAGVVDPTPEGADLDTKIRMRREAIQAFLLSFGDRESLVAKLNEVNLAWGNVFSHREVFDKQASVEAREILTTVDDRSGGERRITNTPYKFSAAEAGVRGPAPYRGEHNFEAVTDWLGDDAPDLESLHNAGVLLEDENAGTDKGDLMGLLDGKVIIVTGAGRGIGRCHAELLAQEGASVVVNDLGGEWDGTGADQRPAAEVADGITASGGKATANFDSVSQLGGRPTHDQPGGRDLRPPRRAGLQRRLCQGPHRVQHDRRRVGSVIDVHLKGHFAPTRWATAYWRERFKETGQPVNAAIVYTASEAGLFGNAGQPNYSAAKAGIASLGIVVAREMKRYGVTCNTINPRARTRMTINTFGADKLTGAGTSSTSTTPPTCRRGSPTCAATHAADITGQTFVVGGDTVALMEGWHRVNRIRKGKDRWTPAELVEARAELFGDRSTGAPKFAM